MLERVEIDSRRVGVIERHRGTMPMGHLGNRWHILNLHRYRARAFAPDQASIAFDQLLDPASDKRVIITNLHVVTTEYLLCEMPAWTIYAVRHERMFAGIDKRKVDQSKS